MGFQPDRLTEAREARDLTMTALADVVGRKLASISHYESGRHEPPPDVAQALADALNVKVGFFYQPARRARGAPTFFRSMAATTKRARTRADRRLDWASDILSFVQQHVEIGIVDLPAPLVTQWQDLTSPAIEDAAAHLRLTWGLGNGPIPNLVWLVEQHGIVVVRDSIDNRHLDAHSSWFWQRPIIVLNDDKKSAVRSRYDCAHELGHLVLHRHVDAQDIRKRETLKQIEEQANLFAAAFMMPAQSFAAEARPVSLEGLLHLKPRWKLSVGAMLYRANTLGLVGEEQSERLWRSLSRRGWRKREPFDDSMLPELPRTLAASFEVIAENRLTSREAVLSATQLGQSDIEALAGLGDGYLSTIETKVLPFRRSG